ARGDTSTPRSSDLLHGWNHRGDELDGRNVRLGPAGSRAWRMPGRGRGLASGGFGRGGRVHRRPAAHGRSDAARGEGVVKYQEKTNFPRNMASGENGRN